jgi:aspartate-semialdehyde dehydrogenase
MLTNKEQYNIAIVGIRGAVGECMLALLQERDFPVGELRLMSTNPADCQPYDFCGKIIQPIELAHDAFEGIDIVLSSPGATLSKEFTPSAVKAGAIVIDNTSQYRMDPDVPLVVPEVNPEDANKHQGIIANPNCSTIQMVVALKPLHDFGKIERIVVSTYQSVSGAGAQACQELKNQINGDTKAEQFPHPILNNLIPHIDAPQDNMYTKEEMKLVNETRKIMGDDSIKVTATCVRVPVLCGHSESVNIETKKKINRDKAIELLSNAPGVIIIDDLSQNKYPMPADAEGKDDTFVGRIREDESIENGLNLWIVCDNLRKGAALNAIQIAEHLIRSR